MGKKILFSLDRGLPSSTKYGASLSLTIDDEYIISGQLLDQNGDSLGETQTLDLPLESVVVDGSYDSENKALILTLNNGNTTSIPVGDLVNGLQPEITPENKLSADLVDDSSTDNKFVTQSEKDAIATVSDKVNKTDSANKIYGTDSSGEQVVYDKDLFGQVYETKTIQAIDWSALSDSSPYTYYATITATAIISAETVVELINDNPVLFATYGFAIASVSGQNITIYSIGVPSADTALTIGIGG